MTSKKASYLIFLFLFLTSLSVAQKNEISLTIGAVTSSDQREQMLAVLFCTISNPNCNNPTFSTDPGVGYEAAFARQLIHPKAFSLSLELPVLGAPARAISNNSFPTGQGVASVFFTPGVKFNFLPDARISPFATVGGGLAHFRRFGTDKNTGAFQFGGGFDFKLPVRLLSFRAEVRDFLSGTSIVQSGGLVVRTQTSIQHNVFAGGGLVLHF